MPGHIALFERKLALLLVRCRLNITAISIPLENETRLEILTSRPRDQNDLSLPLLTRHRTHRASTIIRRRKRIPLESKVEIRRASCRISIRHIEDGRDGRKVLEVRRKEGVLLLARQTSDDDDTSIEGGEMM